MQLRGVFRIYLPFIDQNEAFISANERTKSCVGPNVIFVLKLTLSNPLIVSLGHIHDVKLSLGEIVHALFNKLDMFGVKISIIWADKP